MKNIFLFLFLVYSLVSVTKTYGQGTNSSDTLRLDGEKHLKEPQDADTYR